MFYWNSQGVGGGPIQLVQNVNECSYKEAVKFLQEENLSEFKHIELEKKEFKYYMKEHDDLSKTKNYLINKRQLSKETVDFFISQGLIAQGTYKDKEKNHQEPTIIFKHKNNHGELKGISYQGVSYLPNIHGEDRPFLKRTYGDGFYGMSVQIGNVPTGKGISEQTPLKIIAFESPIDLMSYYELKKEELSNVTLLSMNGLRKGTILTYIANQLGSAISDEKKVTMLDDLQKQTKSSTDSIQVTLAVDNDEAGKKFVNDFAVDFIQVKSELPSLAEGQKVSDWNDKLKERSGAKMNLSEKDKLIKDLSELKKTESSLIKDINQSISDNPLSEIQKLQFELYTTQQHIGLLENDLKHIEVEFNSEIPLVTQKNMTHQLASIETKMTELINKRDSLVNSSDFLNQSSFVSFNENTVARFHELDKKIVDLEGKKEAIQNQKKASPVSLSKPKTLNKFEQRVVEGMSKNKELKANNNSPSKQQEVSKSR